MEQSIPLTGWVGIDPDESVRYTAYIESNTSLKKAVIKGAYESDMRDLVADADPENEYDRNRFSTLENLHCWFNLLAPENLLEQNESFKRQCMKAGIA